MARIHSVITGTAAALAVTYPAAAEANTSGGGGLLSPESVQHVTPQEASQSVLGLVHNISNLGDAHISRIARGGLEYTIGARRMNGSERGGEYDFVILNDAKGRVNELEIAEGQNLSSTADGFQAYYQLLAEKVQGHGWLFSVVKTDPNTGISHEREATVKAPRQGERVITGQQLGAFVMAGNTVIKHAQTRYVSATRPNGQAYIKEIPPRPTSVERAWVFPADSSSTVNYSFG